MISFAKKKRNGRKSYLFVAFLFYLLVVFSATAHTENNIEILVIHSYHQDYPWTYSQHQGFIKTLNTTLPNHHLDISVEHLETKWLSPTPDYRKLFMHYLISKHKFHPPDIIYVTDDNALDFLRNEKFQFTTKKEIPIIFSGINNMELLNTLDPSQFTGVFEKKEYKKTALLAKSMNPNGSHIRFFGDGSSTDIANQSEIIKLSKEITNPEIVYAKGSDIAQLKETFNQNKDDLIILTTIGAIKDENGKTMHLSDTLKLLAEYNRKILVMEDAYLVPGIIGGYVSSGHLQGVAAATIASRIILGEAVSSIPPITENTSQLILNWESMNSHGIKLKEKYLKEARITNKPLSLIEQYPALTRWLILFLVFSIIFGLILFILINRRKNHLIKKQSIDNLTGLFNRTRLIQDLSEIERPYFAMFDINNFKTINSLYGMRIGDEMLKSVAKQISIYLNNEIRLYRLYGDRFGILPLTEMEFSSFESLVSTIVREINQKHYYNTELEVRITVTAGISHSQKSHLLFGAEQALQLAKSSNQNLALDSSTGEIIERQKQNILWAHRLSEALKEDRIVPFFQPILNSRNNRIEKFEALARMIGNDGSIITPNYFLPAAKQTRQYEILTRTMIKKCVEILQNSQHTISLNFTVEDIRNPDTIQYLNNLVHDTDIATRLIIELTETEGIENYEEIRKFVDDIRTIGCRVAIDDFGTGYSNFIHLMHLNVDFLKIDGSIIRHIMKENNNSLEVIKTLVDFSKRLNIKTIAENVDSQEALEILTKMDIDYFQGYHIGRPKAELTLS